MWEKIPGLSSPHSLCNQKQRGSGNEAMKMAEHTQFSLITSHGVSQWQLHIIKILCKAMRFIYTVHSLLDHVMLWIHWRNGDATSVITIIGREGRLNCVAMQPQGLCLFVTFFSQFYSNYCTTDGWVDDFTQITALSFTYPQLFVGTNGGHLLVFKVLDNLPIIRRRDSIIKAGAMTSNRTKSAIDYKLLTAIHCGPLPITGIQPIPVRREFPSRSPLESSNGTPNFSVQVLLICGGDQGVVSSSQVQLYELFSSPRVSPVMSPLSCRSETLSICSSCSSLSNRRDSVSRSLPKLTLHSASGKTLTCLPLKDSD